jgi:hypothetical protein
MSEFILNNAKAKHVMFNGLKDPLMILNGTKVWPNVYNYYFFDIGWADGHSDYLSVDGLSADQNQLNTTTCPYGEYWANDIVELTTSEILDACSTGNQALVKNCAQYRFKVAPNAQVSSVSFYSNPNSVSQGDVKLTCYGVDSQGNMINLATTTATYLADTTYTLTF